MWSLLDDNQRARALQRAHALVRFDHGQGDVSAKQAAEYAGVSLVRFYQMNTKWREQRSLLALGVDAAPEKRRRSQFAPVVNDVLQVAARQLAADQKASIRSLALRLAEIAGERGVPAGELPSHNTLRLFVERARRDLRREFEVGNALLLDHAACGLQRTGKAPWVLFAVVDEASQLILGAYAGDGSGAAKSYARAADDALRRIHDPALQSVVWAQRLARMQLVPGAKEARVYDGLVEVAAAAGVGFNLTADRKAGRYLEKTVGPSIGVLPIWPGRTSTTTRLPDWAAERTPRLDRAQANARIQLAVDEYNSQLIAQAETASGSRPPTNLIEVLTALALLRAKYC